MLVMVLALGCVSITAEAATKTKKMTMYVGETFSYWYTGMGTVKSVKTSKKKVVAAKKVKKGSTIYNQMTAKKKGSAKVTVKGTRGTYVYNITVKATPKIEVSFVPRADGYLTVNVNNKSKVNFDSVTVNITYKDAAGNVLGSDTANVYYLGAKKSAADDVYPYVYPYDEASIDWNQTTFEVIYDRDPDYKYTDYTKKIKWTESVSNGYLNITTKTTYKGDNSIYAAFSVLFYDAAGNVIGVTDGYNFLSGDKKYRTRTYDMRMPDGAVSYQILKRAVMRKYNK